MATKLVPFCSNNYCYLMSTMRIPGEEKDEIKCYVNENPTHGVVYRWVCTCMRHVCTCDIHVHACDMYVHVTYMYVHVTYMYMHVTCNMT